MSDTQKIHFYLLRSGMVVDRSVLVGLTSDQLQTTLSGIQAASVTTHLKVIDNAKSFFTSENMLVLIRADDQDYRLIAEQAQVDITPADIAAIHLADKVQAAIVLKMTPPIPPYTFDIVPEGWTVADYLSITAGERGTVVRKKPNPNGGGTGYRISLKQLQRIWLIASRRWANLITTQLVGEVNADGYRKPAYINNTSIDIGCQRVQRYELEQLAKHQGWEFPEPVAK